MASNNIELTKKLAKFHEHTDKQIEWTEWHKTNIVLGENGKKIDEKSETRSFSWISKCTHFH